MTFARNQQKTAFSVKHTQFLSSIRFSGTEGAPLNQNLPAQGLRFPVAENIVIPVDKFSDPFFMLFTKTNQRLCPPRTHPSTRDIPTPRAQALTATIANLFHRDRKKESQRLYKAPRRKPTPRSTTFCTGYRK